MEQQEPIYPESLRKYTPIVAALAIVLLVAFFFLPKSAASVMRVDAAKVTACCVSAGAATDAGTELSADDTAALVQLLRDARIKTASHTADNGLPAADYAVTVTSGGKAVSFTVSSEGYLFFDSSHYQMKRGGDELIQFLQSLPANTAK